MNRNKKYISLLAFVLVFGLVTMFPASGQTPVTNPKGNQTTAYDMLQQESNHTTVSISTDRSSYNQGDTIVMTGHVNPVNSTTAITIRLFNSHQNMVAISQLLPSSDGSFTKTVLITGPLWQDAGTYTIVVQYGKYTQTTTTFYYNGGNGQSTISQVPNSTSSVNNPSVGNSQNTPSSLPIPPISTTASKIPNWIKHIFILYGQGQVSEDELLNALKFLIQQGILKVS